MISFGSLLFLLFTHWLFDFVFQSDEMAINKSKSFKWLSLHCLIYGMGFLWVGVAYAAANALFHYSVDSITSKFTSSLWLAGDRNNFFTVIGLDQFVHVSILVLTYILMGA